MRAGIILNCDTGLKISPTVGVHLGSPRVLEKKNYLNKARESFCLIGDGDKTLMIHLILSQFDFIPNFLFLFIK